MMPQRQRCRTSRSTWPRTVGTLATRHIGASHDRSYLRSDWRWTNPRHRLRSMTRMESMSMSDLEALETDPAAQLALELAREDQEWLGKLVARRRGLMSQERIAEILGVSQATVSAFERMGNDPHLSTVRRYA